MKHCPKCNSDLEETAFYAVSRAVDRPNKKLSSYCKECHKIISVEYRKSGKQSIADKKCSRGGGRFSRAKKTAKYRGFAWELTREEYAVLITLVCHYCDGKLNECGVGLDRKDNSQGYVQANVVPCCGRCNTVKYDHFTYEQMVKIGNVIKTFSPDPGLLDIHL